MHSFHSCFWTLFLRKTFQRKVFSVSQSSGITSFPKIEEGYVPIIFKIVDGSISMIPHEEKYYNFQGFSAGENQPKSNFNEITLSIFENVFAFFGTLNKNGAVIMLKGNIFDKTVLNPELLNGQRFSETVFWQSSEYTPKILERAIEECASGKNSKVLLRVPARLRACR